MDETGFRAAFEALETEVSDIRQRLDTLQTPLWKRVLFRLDGWPGQKNLNAERPAWRPWRRWFTTCLALVLIAGPAQAGPSNDPLTMVLDERTINQPVDELTWCLDCIFTDWTTQEPWVVNPTECMWDTDDEFVYRSQGNVLAAGASVTVTECGYRSGQSVVASTRLSSPSPNLVVTYRIGQYVETIPAVFNPATHRYEYFGCFVPGPGFGQQVEVPGSHGGMAVPVVIEVTIHNAGSKVGKTGGTVSYGWQPYWRNGC